MTLRYCNVNVNVALQKVAYVVPNTSMNIPSKFGRKWCGRFRCNSEHTDGQTDRPTDRFDFYIYRLM